VVATYASAVAVCASSLLIGQGVMALCGRRDFSALTPAVGLALVCALAWGTVRLPGEGLTAAIVIGLAALASAAYLPGRFDGAHEAVRVGAPVALIGLLAGSLPFIAEWRFGILGTSFNPDMSQHLLAASRLVDGQTSQLLEQGYPLGPHAVAVALDEGLGAGLVQSFSGLTLAVAVLAPLSALAAFRGAAPVPRAVAALLVGLPYMVASYYAQGAFKETMEALLVLAFALGLREIATGAARPGPLVAVPLALVAAGSLYVYSFPGLAWIAAALVFWAALELLWSGRGRANELGAAALRPAALALLVFAVLAAPELGRMVDFREFETFDPAGPGLGNLFGQISPFEALGVWPSGDFRLTPGDGAAPAIAYYLGVALGLALLVHGLAWAIRHRDAALPAALLGAVLIWGAARATGTPYQAAKAVEVMAPLALAVIAMPLAQTRWSRLEGGGMRRFLPAAAGAAFAAAAVGCSLLALANAPVGPTSYAPELTGLRPVIGESPTFVLASTELIEEEHGVPYLAWELRGGRICIAPESRAEGPAPPGVRFVITEAAAGQAPPFAGTRLVRPAGPYRLWRVDGAGGPSDCPLIAVREARQGEARE
jgi:hypothetical protein